MTRLQTAASLLIAYHVLALAVAAVPDWSTSFLPPGVAGAWSSIRQLTRPYLAAGLDQRWQMFSRPYTADKYVRIDNYVTTSGRAEIHAFRELALPATPDTGIRLSYEYRDKAILYALEQFTVDAGDRSDGGLDEVRARYFEPITRYFAGRVARSLAPDEQLDRTELWYGEAPIPPPGEVVSPDLEAARQRALGPYRGPPARVPGAADPSRMPGSTEREADVLWTMIYIGQH